jgi:hypothetical protein
VVNCHFQRFVIAAALIGALVAFDVSRAWAQQAPAPAPAPGQAPAAPAAAPLPPIAPSHLAVARDVVIASGLPRSFDPMIFNIASQLLAAYVAKRPGNAKDFEEILGSLKPELDAKKKEIIDKAAEAYARGIDEATLKQILVFLNSPIGVKYTTALPDVLNGVADASDAWLKDVATMMGTRVVDEMKKRGVDMSR